jgi:hypothetical protein
MPVVRQGLHHHPRPRFPHACKTGAVGAGKVAHQPGALPTGRRSQVVDPKGRAPHDLRRRCRSTPLPSAARGEARDLWWPAAARLRRGRSDHPLTHRSGHRSSGEDTTTSTVAPHAPLRTPSSLNCPQPPERCRVPSHKTEFPVAFHVRAPARRVLSPWRHGVDPSLAFVMAQNSPTRGWLTARKPLAFRLAYAYDGSKWPS